MSTIERQKICFICGNKFVPTCNRGLTCGLTCSSELRRRRRQNRRAERPERLKIVKVCQACGESFRPWIGKQRFCSRRCSNGSRRSGNRSKRRVRTVAEIQVKEPIPKSRWMRWYRRAWAYGDQLQRYGLSPSWGAAEAQFNGVLSWSTIKARIYRGADVFAPYRPCRADIEYHFTRPMSAASEPGTVRR
jgi:hypothetical protein